MLQEGNTMDKQILKIIVHIISNQKTKKEKHISLHKYNDIFLLLSLSIFIYIYIIVIYHAAGVFQTIKVCHINNYTV